MTKTTKFYDSEYTIKRYVLIIEPHEFNRLETSYRIYSNYDHNSSGDDNIKWFNGLIDVQTYLDDNYSLRLDGSYIKEYNPIYLRPTSEEQLRNYGCRKVPPSSTLFPGYTPVTCTPYMRRHLNLQPVIYLKDITPEFELWGRSIKVNNRTTTECFAVFKIAAQLHTEEQTLPEFKFSAIYQQETPL